MGRACAICTAGASAFVREKVRESRSPAAIIQALKAKYQLDIKYYQYRFHVMHHDPQAGTAIVTKNAADARMQEANTLYAQSQKTLQNVMSHLENVTSMWGSIDPEKFKLLRPDVQARTINHTIEIMGKLKKLEMEQKKQDLEINTMLEDINRLASQAQGKSGKQE